MVVPELGEGESVKRVQGGLGKTDQWFSAGDTSERFSRGFQRDGVRAGCGERRGDWGRQEEELSAVEVRGRGEGVGRREFEASRGILNLCGREFVTLRIHEFWQSFRPKVSIPVVGEGIDSGGTSAAWEVLVAGRSARCRWRIVERRTRKVGFGLTPIAGGGSGGNRDGEIGDVRRATRGNWDRA